MAEKLLVIIPCGISKIWEKRPQRGPTPAREAYTGPPFKVNREFAELYADRWVILSAKYGFIDPEFVIPGPYEVTFKKKATAPISYDRLAVQVVEKGLDRYGRIIVLGGEDYQLAVQAAFEGTRVNLEFPSAGLPVGKAMQFVKGYDPTYG